jgi:hypothetical protein
MEQEQDALKHFINLHCNKVALSKERCLHYTDFKESGVSLNVKLETMDQEEFRSKMDMTNPLNQWVMNQMTTFDPDHEILIGLRFRHSFVLSHVVRLKPKEDDD